MTNEILVGSIIGTILGSIFGGLVVFIITKIFRF